MTCAWIVGHDSDERKLIATYRSFFVVKGIRHSIFIFFVESILGKAKSATRKKTARKRQRGKRDQNVKEGTSGVETLTGDDPKRVFVNAMNLHDYIIFCRSTALISSVFACRTVYSQTK